MKCERCKKREWEEAMNFNGEIYFYCRKCYIKIQYPISTR